MTQTYSEDCSAIAFYGFSVDATSFSDFYNVIIKHFAALNCPPSKLGVMRSSSNPKMVDFSSGSKRLIRMGFTGIRLISIVSSTPDARVFSDDYLLSASCGNIYTPLAVFVGRSSLVSLTPTSLLPLAQSYVSILKPKYGIGFTRPHRFGPTSYAGGSVQGLDGNSSPAERIEIESINRWGVDGKNARVWERGLLRDVYPWNFLSPPHLSRSVHGVPLEKWIQKDAHRGKLNMLTDGAYFWEVSENDIGAIRRELSLAGIIFDWKKHL